MVMVVFVLIAALVILGAILVLTGRVDPGLSTDDRPPATPLPAGPLTAADVRGLNFRVGLRGYRMQDVDAALATMAAELERRDAAT
jgi:DivIVA domain-containing protein